MNILESLDYLKDQIETVTAVSDVALSPPEISPYIYTKRNFPAVNVWDNGYQGIGENTPLQSCLRRYTINVILFVKNQQDELLENAYREILTLERQINNVIADLSAQGDGTDFTLKSQSSSGVRALQQENASFYLLSRITTYIIDVVEV